MTDIFLYIYNSKGLSFRCHFEQYFYSFIQVLSLLFKYCLCVCELSARLLTQAQSLNGCSGKETAMYSFLVHTATTKTSSVVKKASKPVPLAVKKLHTGHNSFKM